MGERKRKTKVQKLTFCEASDEQRKRKITSWIKF